MWLTAEWMDYWLDVGSGEYATGERPEWLSRPTVIRAIQKPDPAPVTFTPRRDRAIPRRVRHDGGTGRGIRGVYR